MEVKEGNINEAIGYLGKIKDILWPNISNTKYKVYEEKIINIMALLNELKKLKSLESENKKLKKENEAYKGMWEELPNKLEDVVFNDCLFELARAMDVLKEKYIGGEE
jgi:predicted RNase H-like nuclease (RuvC/YqgF family)